MYKVSCQWTCSNILPPLHSTATHTAPCSNFLSSTPGHRPLAPESPRGYSQLPKLLTKYYCNNDKMPHKSRVNPNNKRLKKHEVIKLHIVALERTKAANDEKTTKHITALLAQLEGSRGGSSNSK